MPTETPEAQLEILKRGAAQIISEAELLAKLRLGRPLNVKLGVDPTAPDIHLGFTVCLQKLRQFQDLGHNAILIIGDFTAMIGDPTGRSKTRMQLTHDQVMANAKSFQEQAFKILDPARTRTVFNGEWFEIMTFDEVMKLNSRVTMQQMLQREDFRKRIDAGEPVHLHEVQYPIMQGWDSVKIKADVELGGTDQLFNILVGRDLQREEKQPEQVVFLMPLLVGTDGVQKMSKSYGNYVGVAEPPQEQFGKLMSISDETMGLYYTLLLSETLPDIHPMEAKKQLASRIVERFHGREAAQAALEDFNTRFSKRDLADADLPQVPADQLTGDIVSVVVTAYAQAFQMTKSRGDARRLVEQGSVQLNGTKISNPKETPQIESGAVLRLDKTRAVRVS
ncbi:tyrosine--tRNA ligase [Verrucomicrobiota bacterium sgz303538]